MRCGTFFLAGIIFFAAGCVIDAGLEMRHGSAYRSITQSHSRYMPEPTDWDNLFKKPRAFTQEIHIFKKGKVGYLETYRAPWYDDYGKVHTRTAYKVKDTNLKDVGFFTSEGRTYKYTRTAKGDLNPVWWGIHEHNVAIKWLLALDQKGIVEIHDMDIDWILSDEYPTPKKELPTSPKKEEGEEEDED